MVQLFSDREREKEKLGIIANDLPEKRGLREEGYIALDLQDFDQL